MKPVRILTAAAVLLICAALILGTTLAWQTSGDNKLNDFYNAGVRGKIVEVFEPPADGFWAGTSITKKVNVTNDSGTPIFVRVMAMPVISQKAQDTPELVLSTDVVEFDINTTDWTDGGDGYYYYRHLLLPGETTRVPLFTKVKLSADFPPEYENASLTIYVLSEVCGVNKNYGYRTSYWGGQAAGQQTGIDTIFKQLTDNYFE